jgi:hypothetical protein
MLELDGALLLLELLLATMLELDTASPRLLEELSLAMLELDETLPPEELSPPLASSFSSEQESVNAAANTMPTAKRKLRVFIANLLICMYW